MREGLLSFVVREVLYSGHIQSFGAVSIVLLSAVFLGVEPTIGMALVPYLLFQAIYFHDRYSDLNTDVETNRERSEHLKSYFHVIPFIIAALALAALLIVLMNSNAFTFIISILIIIFGLLYPKVMKNLTRFIPLFKNIYVALVFGILVFLPFIYSGSEETQVGFAIPLFLYIFIQSVIIQILLDLKDRSSDAQQGLKTLAVLIGTQKAALIAMALSIALFISTFWYALSIDPSIPLLYLSSVGFAGNMIVLWCIFHGTKHRYILAASQYIVWLTVLILL